MRKSKLYRAQAATYDRQTKYSIQDAVALLKSMPHIKVDETVDGAIRLGVDTRESDQNVRGAVA